MEIAQFLEKHPKISRVAYPGLLSFSQHDLARRQMVDYDGNFAPGTMLYFVVGGSPLRARNKAARLIDYVARKAYSITLAVSLGQVRTLIEHPSSMTSSSMPLAHQIREGIDPGGVRLSIGLESTQDILQDLVSALDQV